MTTDAERYRTRTKVNTSRTWTYQTYSSPLYTNPGMHHGEKESMWDHVTPGFPTKMKSGAIIMNPMVKAKVSQSSGTISNYYGYLGTNPAQWTRFTGDCSDYDLQSSVGMLDAFGSFGVLAHSDINALITEVCTRVRSQRGRSNVDSWENLAEARQSIAMLRRPLDAFYRIERSGKKVLTPESAYLMYRYGVRPLYQSSVQVVENLRRVLRPKRESTRDSKTISSNVTSTVSFGTSTTYRTYRIDKTESATVRAVSIDEVEWSKLRDFGFSGKSLLTLPWELIPYSFVADWFVNTGDLIGSLVDQVYAPTHLGGCYTLQYVGSESRTSTGWTDNSGATTVSPPMSWLRRDIVRKQRIPVLAAPGLVIKSDFRLDDLTRVADGLALIAQKTRLLGPVMRLFTAK